MAELWHKKDFYRRKRKEYFDKVSAGDSKVKDHFYTSVHSETVWHWLPCSLFVGGEINACANEKKSQATEGRDTHMEVRQKGVDINRKTTTGVTVTIEFPFCTVVKVCRMSLCACACMCVFMWICMCVSPPLVCMSSQNLLSAYIDQPKLNSPSVPAPFKKWTSQWGDTAQVSIFPQETSVYISKWVQKESCFDWQPQFAVKSAFISPLLPVMAFFLPRGASFRGRAQCLCHGFLPRESPIVECVHVNDFLRLDNDGRLWLLFETALALERHPQLVHHGTAERSLWRERRRGYSWQHAVSPTA